MIAEFISAVLGIIAITIFVALSLTYWTVSLPILWLCLLFWGIRKWRKDNAKKQSYLNSDYQNGGVFPKGVVEDNDDVLSFTPNKN
ncbi:hypothetical protein QJU89_05790 [Pasteurella skyensis]|uniref:Uncharacterized protein n=1 Tax=Phocoenobacter skyensis TaxID=97481 RepID=A0AAJ6N9G6_9PAST|nr:hypothetical protein [Pasteurella skyensis]MDP8172611.1 hypothetical protein [Pasteurella skyensis]MDP8179111.1 hypothetical protein [Pasteurella skyensis]MDP8183204.1 hypothetical protein [Pasteurella skyensis]MDP8189255.1 hypothetical protein [Pasteurella skyensis]